MPFFSLFTFKVGLSKIESVILRLLKPASVSLFRANLDQRGSPAWSAAGRTGGGQTGPGCPCDERRTPVHGGGAFVQRPSLGGYLSEERGGGEEGWCKSIGLTRLIADI